MRVIRRLRREILASDRPVSSSNAAIHCFMAAFDVFETFQGIRKASDGAYV